MAGNKPKTPAGTCAHCQSKATKKCNGCLDAPVYNNSDATVTFYCSSACQKAGWEQHKAECKKLQARKSVDRAALMLQSIIFKIRLHAWSLCFDSVFIRDSTMYLRSDPSRLDSQMKPFTVPVHGDKSHPNAPVVLMGSTESMVYLEKFARHLLDDLCSNIEEVNVYLKNMKLRIVTVLPSGQHVVPPPFHSLYRVTLKNGEKWAIDPTGAQHGFINPLCPWHEFEKDRVAKIDREMEFGYIGRNIFGRYAIGIKKELDSQTLEKQELAKALEGKIPSMAQAHAGKLNGVLKGSDTAFKESKHRFMIQFEGYMLECMIRLYTPREMLRRNKEIEGRVPRDPTSPKVRRKIKRVMGMFKVCAPKE